MLVGGSFIQTLLLVDVTTGWTECLPLIVQEEMLVVQAIQRAQGLFPWLICGLDFDNVSAFRNDVVVSWCRARGMEVTRSRAYKKNDQIAPGRYRQLSAAQRKRNENEPLSHFGTCPGLPCPIWLFVLVLADWFRTEP
jgi:hypothetical protein